MVLQRKISIDVKTIISWENDALVGGKLLSDR